MPDPAASTQLSLSSKEVSGYRTTGRFAQVQQSPAWAGCQAATLPAFPTSQNLLAAEPEGGPPDLWSQHCSTAAKSSPRQKGQRSNVIVRKPAWPHSPVCAQRVLGSCSDASAFSCWGFFPSRPQVPLACTQQPRCMVHDMMCHTDHATAHLASCSCSCHYLQIQRMVQTPISRATRG